MATEDRSVIVAARRLAHHYYCVLPTVGVGRCRICSDIADPNSVGTMTVLVGELNEAVRQFAERRRLYMREYRRAIQE